MTDATSMAERDAHLVQCEDEDAAAARAYALSWGAVKPSRVEAFRAGVTFGRTAALRPSPSREEPPDLRKLGKAREQFVTGSPHWLAINDAYSEIVLLRSQLAALRPASSGGAWRPIEEAPTDGTPIWAYQPNGTPQGAQYIAWMDDHPDCGPCWFDEQDSEPEPTHWRPLPSPPADPVRA